MSGQYSRRLFFALWPDRRCRRRLAAATEVLRQGGAIGRPVPVANYHLTLVFLGDVPVAQLPQIERLASRVRFTRFWLTLDRFGYFARAQVAWLGCSTVPDALVRLEQQLRQGLEDIRCLDKAGARAYRPHLTVARKTAARPDFPLPPATRWQVDQFALVESLRAPDGVDYQVIGRFPAGSAAGR